MPKPPSAAKAPVEITQIGRTRIDEFAWLKDENWRAVMRDPTALDRAIRAHLEAENAYTATVMADTEALQATLYEEMRGRLKQDESGVPHPDGPFEYSARFEAGAQHPRYVRTPRGGGEEQVLLDVEALAAGKAYFQVGDAQHAPSHRFLAYAADDQGSEVYRVYIRDLATGADLPGVIDNVAYGSFVWSPCSAFIFWVFRDDNGRPARVYRRPFNGADGDDVLVHEEPDEGMFVGVSVSESRAFIQISCANQETSETYLIPAQTPTAAARIFARREPGVLYEPTHYADQWMIRTNADGAVDFKVMTCPLDQTEREHWRDLIAHRSGTYVEGLQAFADHLARLERVNALPRLVISTRSSGEEHVITQDEAAYALTLDPGHEFDTRLMRFVYQSPTTPRRWVDYDMTTRERTLRKTQEVPSGHDPARYEVRRFNAIASDGAEIPVTVLKRRDVANDGAAPLLLYGYGSYGVSQEASFSTNRFSLVDRGWIWAVAHVRGGADKGRSWFEDGRKDKKINTFTDFCAVADALVAQGYSKPRRIVAYGGSAGGLLVGAVANLRPELWGGIVAAVPFVDALNTMSDASLPLTPPEWPEWGNPLEDPAAYDTIAAYSPYDNVSDRPYPPILATGGLSDPRVTYWEPAKWIARLRDRALDAGPYLLRINMEAGHGGASGRFEYLKEIAFDYAFALKALGDPQAGAPFG